MSRLIAYAFLAFISSKGLLATYYLTPGCVGGGVKLGSETSSGDGAREKIWVPSPENLRAEIIRRKTRSPEWKSALLKMKVGTCWVGKNSKPNSKLFFIIFLEIKQMLNLSSGLLLSTLGGDVCGLHRFLCWSWGLSCGLLCSFLCHVDWSSVWVTRYLLGKGLNPSWTRRMCANMQLAHNALARTG